MRRGLAVGAAIAAVIALVPAPGQGGDAAAASGSDNSTGRQAPVLVHGDVFPPDADQQLARARMRSLAPADNSLQTRQLAGAWCGGERSTDDYTHAASGNNRVIKVVYASPSDYPDRFTTYADMIQSDVRAAMSTIQSAAEGSRTLRVDLGTSCGPDYVDIASVRLRQRSYYATSSFKERADRISADVEQALGGMGVHDTLIYGDGLNAHNNGGHYAILLGSSTAGSASPNFTPAPSRVSSVLHELGHALGAVQVSAPHSTGAGHCTDGADVLCYADGGPRGHWQDITAGCAATDPAPFDCGADDYFSPHPAPGSYLATHWNIYDSAFLCVPASCFSGGRRAPQASIVVRDASGNAIDSPPAGANVVLDGSSSSDSDGSVTGWTWDVGDDGSIDGTGPQLAMSFPAPGSVNVRLRVTDDAGLPDATTRTVAVGAAAPAGSGQRTNGTGKAADGSYVEVTEDPSSVLRRRLRQARSAAEKRLRKIGTSGLAKGKTLVVRYRSPEEGEVTASLNLKDLPVVIETAYARPDAITSLKLRVSRSTRKILRHRRASELKLQLDFEPAESAGVGRQPR
jgi:hypothetical protein